MTFHSQDLIHQLYVEIGNVNTRISNLTVIDRRTNGQANDVKRAFCDDQMSRFKTRMGKAIIRIFRSSMA